MQERFYSVQKACFYVCPGAQANEGVAFLQEIHGAFPFQWRRTGRTFGGPLFFFLHLSCPPFFCQRSSRSPCIYICPRSTNYQKYSKGIWIVVGLAHRCHPPHLQPLGVPLLLRALFLQLKHLHLLEHCRLWRTHRQRPIASGIQNPCILDFACRPQWQIKLSFGSSSLLSLTSAKCMQIRHDKSFR